MSELHKDHLIELVYKHRSSLALTILTALSVVTLSVLPASPWHQSGVVDKVEAQTKIIENNDAQHVPEDRVVSSTVSEQNTPPAKKTTKVKSVKLTKAKAREMKIVAAQAMQALGKPVRRDASYAGLSKIQATTVLAIRHHFGSKLFSKAVRIAWCESRLNPTATNRNRNGTTDHGVFQINDGGTMQGLGINRVQAMQLDTNVNAAKKLYDDRGWQPWVCHNA